MCSENAFTYEKMLDYLNEGREIEFSFKGRQYSFTNLEGYWIFCCENILIDRICSFEDKIVLTDYFRNCVIDGVSVKRIFDEKLWDKSSLYVL